VALAEARQAARTRKDWAAADDDRRKITALGWTVQDTPEGFKLAKN
jgi:cysteinyl-tRNA synthetase